MLVGSLVSALCIVPVASSFQPRSVRAALIYSGRTRSVKTQPVIGRADASATPCSYFDHSVVPPSIVRRSHTRTMDQLRATSGGGGISRGSKVTFTWSAFWGIFGVLAILGNAIRRLLPIALEPLKAKDFTGLHWAQYIGFSLFMAYAEGYKGFQLKFSPLIVRRAYSLQSQSPLLHKILAAPYIMGLFHSTQKRKIVSWSLALGVVALVKVVKTLAYPYRSIIDAGVVIGLSYGVLSIAAIFVNSLRGALPQIDPALPETKVSD